MVCEREASTVAYYLQADISSPVDLALLASYNFQV